MCRDLLMNRRIRSIKNKASRFSLNAWNLQWAYLWFILGSKILIEGRFKNLRAKDWRHFCWRSQCVPCLKLWRNRVIYWVWDVFKDDWSDKYECYFVMSTYCHNHYTHIGIFDKGQSNQYENFINQYRWFGRIWESLNNWKQRLKT